LQTWLQDICAQAAQHPNIIFENCRNMNPAELDHLIDLYNETWPATIQPNGWADCKGYHDKGVDWLGLGVDNLAVATRIGIIDAQGDTTWGKAFTSHALGEAFHGAILHGLLGTTEAARTIFHEGGHVYLECDQGCEQAINAHTESCWNSFATY
jgi:hypothetical protein